MDAIVLAAGYATRLYPLTKDKPKPLLDVAGKPIIEHIIRKLEKIGEINKIYIVTNAKFEQHFKDWLKNFDAERPVEIVNDGTTSNEDRLGALGDLHYIIQEKSINGDIILIAGDNLFDLSLPEVHNYFKKRKSNVVVLHDVKDMELAKQYGIVEIDHNNLVVNFVEKPTSPQSTLASTGIYMFPQKTIGLIKKYISQGNNPDKTGNFIEWLHKREKVSSYVTDKKWHDIGSIEQLERANKHYKG
ncbi:nucleotidyltransferase family protein [Candidatus Woesearchaeota archaeon]|nr:nucleotidyltransferase family protein [Candidatus Woesearchaeota archaeon]